MFNYTIIIPHKNSAELLEYCLSTIPVRDDVQVIVVDDNSDPNKVDFSHFPQWAGKNYEYYLTKEGKGAGYARNVGLEHAKGKWLLFVDADDYFAPQVDAILSKYVDAEADIIFFRTKSVKLQDKQTPSSRADAFNNKINRYFKNGDETELRVRFFSPWSKIILRKIIDDNHIRFEEICYSNDNLFAVSIGCVASKIKVVDEELYVLTEQNESLCSDYCNKPGELEIRAAAFLRVSQYIRGYGYPVDKDIVFDFLNRMYKNDKALYRKYFYEFKHLLGYSRTRMVWEQFEGTKLLKRVPYTLLALLSLYA